jgi:hypothetical protein
VVSGPGADIERKEMDSVGFVPATAEPKVETEKERNDGMRKLLDDLKPCE